MHCKYSIIISYSRYVTRSATLVIQQFAILRMVTNKAKIKQLLYSIVVTAIVSPFEITEYDPLAGEVRQGVCNIFPRLELGDVRSSVMS